MKKLLVLLVVISAANICTSVVQQHEIRNNKEYDIKQIEDYFNSIKTLKADFVQVDRNGVESLGVFLLKRSSLATSMKMDYTKPPTQVIIAKNNKVIHYDKELKEKTVTSMYSSPLSFFMESVINLEDAVKVLSVIDEHGTLSITFCKKDPGIDGAITMVFQKNPFVLLKWEIFNSKKDLNSWNSIQIMLLNHKLGKRISDDEFTDP